MARQKFPDARRFAGERRLRRRSSVPVPKTQR